MRPGRLVVLAGTLMATGALYLPHLAVDAARFGALTGGTVPSIWQELGRWGRPTAVLLVAGLVGVAFRSDTGRRSRWWGGAAALVATGGVVAVWLARRLAAEDAALVAAGLREVEAGNWGAAAGPGFWLLLAGAGLAAAGAWWDLVEAGRNAAGRSSLPPNSIGEQDPAAVQ